jgi:DNA helicase II / ATP-dependent DNA helicase PcrA
VFESLSEKQREIVFDKTGKFVVRACPGSGKTFCVAARLARQITNWKKEHQGIAAISFTNVAWREIEKQCKDNFQLNHGISFPHFVGTIDSFVNKYIFLPHGHLVMKCQKRPTLVGDPHGTWSACRYERDYRQYFDRISFEIDGKLKPVKKDAQFFFGGWSSAFNRQGLPNGHYNNLKISKDELVLAGYANQSDANYFAMKLLDEFPSIAKALVLRFPLMIIDETQDTSITQMKIIDLLVQNGLNEIMLVGDPDQAIFEWNGAKPELFNQKINDWGNSVLLNDNRRSSQNICDFTYNISSLAAPSNSVDEPVSAFNHHPKVVIYNDNLPEIVNSFLDECSQNGINVSDKTVSVIYRSKGMINKITGIERIPFNINPWNSQDKFTKDFARGKFLYDNRELQKGFKLIEKAVVKMLVNESYCSEESVEKVIDKIGFIKHRTIVFNFIGLLAATDRTIGEWIDLTNEAFKNKKLSHQLSIREEGKIYSFQQLFLNEDESISEGNYRIGTVHSVKGETFDATLLILNERASNRGKYSNILQKAKPASSHEELRIAYVGMTRPRKVLILAVPNDESKKAWESKLIPDNTTTDLRR